MPLLEIPALQALGNARADRLRSTWPDTRFPSERREGLIEVGCTPKFRIERDDRIFTIGSCFARNIEARLDEIGLDVVFGDHKFVRKLAKTGETPPFANKYNVATIRSEIEWACTGRTPPEDHLLLPLANGAVLDVMFNPHHKRGAPIDQARERRAFVAERIGRVVQCGVVVITLGLAEVWRDLASGLRLNIAPVAAISQEPDRFVLEVLGCDDILEELEGIHRLLTEHGPPGVRILITVSPVPMQATLRDCDVLTANTYSKSVQRAAVEAFCLRHDNVGYFPSFETVTLTDRRLAFESDNRHVQPAAVARIVDRFIAAYAPELAFDPTAARLDASAGSDKTAAGLLSSAKMLAGRDRHAEAAALYGRCIQLHGDQLPDLPTSHLRLKFSTSLLKSGEIAQGLGEAAKAAKAPDADEGLRTKCVERFISHGDHAGAARLLDDLGDAIPAPTSAELRHKIRLAPAPSPLADATMD